MKRCTQCKIEQPLESFNKNSRAKDGRYSWCQTCARAHSNRYYHANREKYLAHQAVWRDANRETIRHKGRVNNRKRLLKANYGLTVDDYGQMVENQGGLCAICTKEPARILSVDHDHETGVVRGLLCDPCNQGLGLFNDRADLLRSAIAYLESPRGL